MVPVIVEESISRLVVTHFFGNERKDQKMDFTSEQLEWLSSDLTGVWWTTVLRVISAARWFQVSLPLLETFGRKAAVCGVTMWRFCFIFNQSYICFIQVMKMKFPWGVPSLKLFLPFHQLLVHPSKCAYKAETMYYTHISTKKNRKCDKIVP